MNKKVTEDIKLIRESQIRMEEDIKHHIQRTDSLQDMVTPVYKLYTFGKYLIALLAILLTIYKIVGIASANTLDTRLFAAMSTLNCKYIVTSGYRDVETNQRVGGAIGSLHLQDRARDIVTTCPKYDVGLFLYMSGLSVIIYEKHLHIDDRVKHLFKEL